MNAILLTLFVSLVLATFAVALFVWAVKRGEPEHSERLALLPLDDDAVPRRRDVQKQKSTKSESTDLQEASVPCDR